MAFLRSVKSRRGIFAGDHLLRAHGLNKPQKSTAGWLVARVSLMLAYAKTGILKSKSMFCVIYRSSKRDQTYLYVEKKRRFFACT